MTHDTARGLAAAYVLGALEPAEETAVREHLRTCPEPHDEFAELGGVVPYLAEIPGLELVEPPASLRERIMAAAAADLEERRSTTTSGPAASASPAEPAARPLAAPPAGAPGSTVPFPSAAERAERAERTGRGAGTLGWAARIAAVAAVRADGSVVMALRDLPATTGTQVYEAWVIAAGSPAPVPVGGFTVGPTGTAAFTTQPVATPPGSTIALSLEPSAGSTTPRGTIVATGGSTAPKS